MKKEIEKEKLVAEKLNGRLAMIGIIAGIGAYLTTGQLIPGFCLMTDLVADNAISPFKQYYGVSIQ